ncbi:MAG: nucleoside triphosphate pyrophosphohydrolase [Eubacterium sp.]|nr:nucleoside triphosphate pyrophosphohydrolase [Eubacterium sp.]
MRVYNKLVRDNIPDIIRKNGEIPCISILDDDKYLDELKTKLIEETNEFIESEELMELADILEVVEYLAKAKGSNLDEILRLKEQKEIKNGAFEKKIFLEFVEDALR